MTKSHVNLVLLTWKCMQKSFFLLFELSKVSSRKALYQDYLWPEISMVNLLYIHTLRFISGVSKCFEVCVVLWAVRNFFISNVKSFFSAWAIFKVLSRLLFWRSASQFAWGHKGVEVLCCMPFVFKNVSNSSDVNCGPLPVFSDCRRPWKQNILSRLPILVADVTDLRMSTSK